MQKRVMNQQLTSPSSANNIRGRVVANIARLARTRAHACAPSHVVSVHHRREQFLGHDLAPRILHTIVLDTLGDRVLVLHQL